MKKPLYKYPSVWLIILFFGIMHYFTIFPYKKLEPLKGAIEYGKDTTFSIKSWLSEDYQHVKEKYINENFAFRSSFVRLHNQLQFSLFKVAFANGVIVGKDNYLYERNYIRAATGSDFIGKDSIHKKVEYMKRANRYLTDDGIKMLVVLAPGKASYFPEYIPDRFGKTGLTTNYDLFRKELLSSGIPFIDFNSWFRSKKDTSKYPLFPKTGVHWSQYGVVLAVDSLTKVIEQLTQTDLPTMQITGIEYSDAIHNDDQDIEDGMNILYKIPKFQMAYPQLKFQNEGKTKIPCVTIADSYYWQIYGSGLAGQFFEPAQFWYYFERCYSTGVSGDWPISGVDIRTELKKQKLVLLITTDANLSRFDYGFSEAVIKAYTDLSDPDKMDTLIRNQVEIIKKTPSWLKAVETKAKQKNIPLDSMLYLDAKWVIENNALK